jgi:hypothetical protein
MVVVVVADDDRVDKGYVFNLAWHLGVSFWPQPAERRTAALEDRIKEHAQPRGKLDVIARMAQPGRSKLPARILA